MTHKITILLLILTITFSCKNEQTKKEIQNIEKIAQAEDINSNFKQIKKDSLLKKDINIIVEQLEFMYGYDQTLREYTIFKTFDKSATNRIENLSDSLRKLEKTKRQFISDTLSNFIFRNYINPMDAIHTKKLIAITKKYGFPSNKRIKKYYNKEFRNPEFSALIIFIHAPRIYWEELKILMKNELNAGRITRCHYGYLLWHVTGRKSFKPMLDNGYILVEENGMNHLKPTCE